MFQCNYEGMKISSFFKILNRKINKYDKMAQNPFMQPQSIVVVWVEEEPCELNPKDVRS